MVHMLQIAGAMPLLVFLTASPLPAATLEAVQGQVSIGESSGSDRVLPFNLQANDEIKTGYNGKARIRLDDGSEAFLGPMSLVLLKEKLEMPFGRVRLRIPAADNRDTYEVLRSRNVRIHARKNGRRAEYFVEADSLRLVACPLEGELEIHAEGWTKTFSRVPAGTDVVVDGGGFITSPVVTDPQKQDLRRVLTSISTSPGGESGSLSDEWRLDGPPTVEALNPLLISRPGNFFGTGLSLWGRALYEADRFSLSPQATMRFAVFPSENWILFADIHAIYTNTFGVSGYDEPSGLRLHQGFWLWRKRAGHSVAIGRQVWDFGDGLIVGRDPWAPIQRSFDGALVTLRTENFRLRFLAALLSMEEPFGGIYADIPSLSLEGYLFWLRRSGEAQILDSERVRGHFGLMGQRAQADLWGPIFANEEAAIELGSLSGPLERQALLAYIAKLELGTRWRLGSVPGTSRVHFLQASGDGNPSDSTLGSFLPLFPDSHRFLGLVEGASQTRTLRNVWRAGISTRAEVLLGSMPSSIQFDVSSSGPVSTVDPVQAIQGVEGDVQMSMEPIPGLLLQLGGGYLSSGDSLLFTQFNWDL